MMTTIENLREKFPAIDKLRLRRPGEIELIHQTTATDCGAACLAMVLAHHGSHVSLERVRSILAVGRDGVTARAIVEAGALLGLVARGVQVELAELSELPRASILHVGFEHFVVFEKVDREGIHVVDPELGRRVIGLEEADATITGVALLFEPGAGFVKTAKPRSPLRYHVERLLRDKRTFARIAVLSVLLQLASLSFPLLEGRIADRVLPRNDTHLLLVLGFGLAASVAFYLVASVVRSQLLLFARTRFDVKLTLGFVDHLFRLPYAFFERRQIGDLQLRVQSVGAVRELLTGAVLSGLIDGTLVVSHLVFLAIMSLKMTVGALAIVVVKTAVYFLTRRRLMEISGSTLAKQADEASALYELLSGAEHLKASGWEHAASQTWAHKHVDVMNVNLRSGHFQSFTDSLMSSLQMLAPVVLLFMGTLDVLEHRMTLGTMLSANAMAIGFIHPTMSLVSTMQHLIQARVHLSRIDDVLGAAPEATPSQSPAAKLAGEITLENVTFAYGPNLPRVADGISLRVRPGEHVAIVGASGSGKTTLARLMLGLYAPTQGTIRFDGTASTALDLRTVRRQFGVVTQRPHVFAGSIRANVAMANPTRPLADVVGAAKLACIHDDIAAMPMGYETPVVAGGTSLSGGQRQRLALARALVEKPSVLLLDEATSALDALTEAALQKNIDALRCTRIVIAHRLSTVAAADRILVMDRGKIVEQGTHAELLARGGVYAKLFAAQLGSAQPSSKESGAPAAQPGNVVPFVARRMNLPRVAPRVEVVEPVPVALEEEEPKTTRAPSMAPREDDEPTVFRPIASRGGVGT